MKKQLLAIAAVAALTPSFNANAEASLTELWKYKGAELNDGWDANDPNWASEDAIKSKSCSRFATGKDGRIYTINMMTMSIAEVTKDGVKDLYKLPSLEGRVINGVPDYYGTAISMDDAGNFLIGHYFVKSELSSQVWSVYEPTTGKIKHFNIGYPNDMKAEDYVDGLPETGGASGLGRIDCVGRVVGDLTDEAIFYIAPQGYKNGASANNVRIVYVYGEGDHDLDKVQFDGSEYIATYLGCTATTNIVQPSITDVMEFGDDQEHFYSFIINSTEGSTWDIIKAFGSGENAVSAAKMQAKWREEPKAKNNGFDTFLLDGHRYFVHGYTEVDLDLNNCPMDIAVYNEEGERVATWANPDYAAKGAGYNSIVAQAKEDGTALIHVYVSTGKTTIGDMAGCGAAAVLEFDPTGSAGVNDIEIDNADAPAVYFNLQGIEVANPENGTFIVRRGNKVTKEIIR